MCLVIREKEVKEDKKKRKRGKKRKKRLLLQNAGLNISKMKNKVYSFQNYRKAQNKGTKNNNIYMKRAKIKNSLETKKKNPKNKQKKPHIQNSTQIS